MPVRPTMSNDFERVEIDLLDVLVDQDDLVLGRRQPGQHRQRQHRHVRLLAEQRQAVVEAPERGREAGVDQADPCHVWTLGSSRTDRRRSVLLSST